MKSIFVVLGVALASFVTGFVCGHLWTFGNWAGSTGLLRLVVVAIPTNLFVAAVTYYVLRGSVAMASAGTTLLVLSMVVNLVITIGIATSIAGAIGAGTAGKLGVHMFSWGMSYAFGQAFHDVRKGTWLHE